MNPTRPPLRDADLVALVLGQVEPAHREDLERRLAGDAGARERHASIRAHLARYDALPAAPPAPPFARVEAALDSRKVSFARARLTPWPSRRLALPAAALVLLALGLGVGLGLDRRTAPGIVAHPGAGLEVLGAAEGTAGRPLVSGDVVRAVGVGALAFGDHARVILDEGARLAVVGPTEVRLVEGRAFFEVARGPWHVEAAGHDVVVRGTVFEVDVREGLVVQVVEGRVEVAGAPLEAGRALGPSGEVDLPPDVGAWFSWPRLALERRGAALAGQGVTLAVVLENPTFLDVSVARPDDVRQALWLAIEDPAGRVHDVQAPGVERLLGAPAGGALRLGPRERRVAESRWTRPFDLPGVYRLRAMYRPEGGAPLVSAPLLLEVR